MQSIPSEETEALKQLVGPRYQLQSLLGNNPGRKTLLALDRETGEPVVLKLLLFGKEFAWQDLKLFEREAETLRSLEHSAIPQYLDYFDVESATVKGFALVQSYIGARSLEVQVAAGRRFSEEELEQIAQQLLEILKYLHSRQPAVIHRDIKPSNILLTDRTAHSVGQVYLVDFGSVQTLAAREGGTITVVGTYGYMPPEQFGGRAVPASDLYSLGATLIYLASGRHPADLPQDELRLEFEEFVQLSPRMVAWLNKLVKPGLGKRFREAKVVSAEIGSTSLESSSDSFSLELLVPPSSSDIRISRDSKKLILDFPSNKLSFRRFDRTNLLNRLLLGFGIGGAAYVFLVYTYLWVASLGLSQTSAATLLLCVGFSLYFCFVYLSSRKSRASLGFFEDTVWIKMPHKKIRSFTLKEVWKFQRGKQNSIRISIGDWRTILYTSRAEQDWLIQILENRIGLPESELAAGSLEA